MPIEIPDPGESNPPPLEPLPNEDPAPAYPEIDDPNRKEQVPESDPEPEPGTVAIPRA